VTGPTTLSTATLYATVQNNVVKNSAGTGIRLNVNAGDPTLNATTGRRWASIRSPSATPPSGHPLGG
jgi:hypothetical protein